MNDIWINFSLSSRETISLILSNQMVVGILNFVTPIALMLKRYKFHLEHMEFQSLKNLEIPTAIQRLRTKT